ncbi:FlaG/FlaF family flagellin (archaellin) [Agrococcus sp. UYP10]|uniref:hypothetical protein n=1 Tax=Agrococcus sp. UYP10 TaxID=1756355 RepID=UPI0033988DAE
MSGVIGAFAGAAVLFVMLLTVGLVLAALRARRDGDAGPVVTAALVVAVVTAVLALIGGTIAVLATLLGPQVSIVVPVREFWPQLPDGAAIDGTSATRVAGGFTAATLLVDGLSTGARVCWAIAQGLAWFVPGLVAVLVAVGCRQLQAGRPFAPVLARLTMITAAVVLVGGLAAQVLGDVAGSMAAAEVLEWTSATLPGAVDDPNVLMPAATFAVEVPMWPVGAGLGLAALAAVLRVGGRLQRDTEGLV